MVRNGSRTWRNGSSPGRNGSKAWGNDSRAGRNGSKAERKSFFHHI